MVKGPKHDADFLSSHTLTSFLLCFYTFTSTRWATLVGASS